MRIGKKAMAVLLAASLAFTSAVPASAEKGYDTDNTDKWKGLYIDVSEVPTPENKDIYFDDSNNIVCRTNVKFQLDCVIDAQWTVSPNNGNVTVDASGLVTVPSNAKQNTTYTITATPENILGSGKSASIKVTVPDSIAPAEVKDICFADTMEQKDVASLSEDKKTINVTGAWKLPIETVVSPSYIANQSTTYASDTDNPSIKVDGDDLFTKRVSQGNIINCTVGKSSGTMPLRVNVVDKPFALNITSDDTEINRDESNPIATISMDQRVQFDITENSEHALNDYGTTSVKDFEYEVSGDTVKKKETKNGKKYEVYDESNDHKIATISIVGSGSAIKAIVMTEKLADNEDISKWKTQNTKLTLSYTKNSDSTLSTRSLILKYSLTNAKFNTVGLDFAKGGLVEDRDFAVYNETVSFKDVAGNKQTREMPVYYFESNYTDKNGNLIDNPLYLSQYTFANGEYKSTVNSFNEDKDNGFDRRNPQYSIDFKLSDIDTTVKTQMNDKIGTVADVDNMKRLTYTDDEGNSHCDALLRKGIGYKVITVSYGEKHEYYVVRFVSRSDDVKKCISMVKNKDDDYNLSEETVHVRRGESVVPVYKNDNTEQRMSTVDDPFLTYTVQDKECAKAFTDGSQIYAISGCAPVDKETRKTKVVVQGKVNKSDKVSFMIYVNKDLYEYGDEAFNIDFTAAQKQELMDSSAVIKGKQDAVPVNVTIEESGAGLPDITWQLEVKGKDGQFIPLDPSIAEIKPDTEAGAATITTKKSSNEVIYVKMYTDGNKQLASRAFTIGAVDATKITELAELVEDGKTAVVKKTKENAGVCGTGDSFQLTPVAYSPENATKLNGNLLWSSSNEEIATVDSDGRVQALSAGNVEIRTSYTVNGTTDNHVYNLTVETKEVPVTDIQCADSFSLTRIEATGNLEATVVPANATNKALKYEIIGDKDVVDVSDKGVVTGKKVGKTQIRISSVGYPEITKVVEVEVKGEDDPSMTTGTPVPTQTPTQKPTQSPSQQPSQIPSQAPSQKPSQSPAASAVPSADTGAQNQGNANNAAKPAKGKVVSVKNVKGKKAKVKVKVVQGAIVYQVTYSTKKNFAGAKSVKTASTSCVLKKLKKGKTYFVKVRAYNSYGYGAYSAAKKVKIKK